LRSVFFFFSCVAITYKDKDYFSGLEHTLFFPICETK